MTGEAKSEKTTVEEEIWSLPLPNLTVLQFPKVIFESVDNRTVSSTVCMISFISKEQDTSVGIKYII